MGEPVDTGANTAPPPAPKTHFTLADEGAEYGKRFQLYTAIAEQIWREQQLVSTRMQWNFTFQAFLAGIFVFAVSNLDGWTRIFVPIVLSSVGFAVSLFCLQGVMAAQNQSTRLKQHWINEFHPSPPADPGLCDVQHGAFPQPFSTKKGSGQGRRASRWVCGALMTMWVFMLGGAIAAICFPPKPETPDSFVCRLAAPAAVASEFALNCTPD